MRPFNLATTPFYSSLYITTKDFVRETECFVQEDNSTSFRFSKKNYGRSTVSLPRSRKVNIIVLRYKNGQEIKPKKNLEENPDKGVYSLIIPASSLEDAGKYKIELSNDVGTAKSDAKVEVEGQPAKIVDGLQDKSVTAGGKVILEATVIGEPKKIKW